MDCYKNVSNIVIYNKYKWIGGNKDEKCISSLFYKDRKNILVEVPDFDILTEGRDMNEAIDMARDAIELKCISMEDDKEDIPDPSRITELDISSGTFAEEGETIVSFVDVDSAEYRRKIDTRTVRRNVALPSWLNYEAGYFAHCI